MSGGCNTWRLVSFGPSGASCGLMTGVNPLWRNAYCSTILCIEYQNGTAICLPARSAKERMPLWPPTTSAEPLVCAQATIFTGT